MSNNKTNVERKLKELTEKFTDNENFNGVTTIDISEQLGIRRNIVSQYLNELVDEGKAIKSKTRPVLFTYLKNQTNISYKREVDDIFKELIGYSGSLKDVVEKCKAAVLYPSKDMSVLLTGDSGVGKSYIASLLHKYAINEKKIKENAPFIIFNCADYADNPELLFANLFGYMKGSFTGADKDHMGALELSHGGYLFLDEVHRLSSEGQEKLFVFMDKGVFKRLGESKAERSADVRLVFATTEDPKTSLLQTFTRRIPLTIKIPRLDERPIDERLTIIHNFFRNEALEINQDIHVNKRVINSILSHKSDGNIGSLKNIVKFCCALAYKEQEDDVVVKIEKRHLQIYEGSINTQAKQYYYEEYMKIKRDDTDINECNLIKNFRHDTLNEFIDMVDEILNKYEKNIININELNKELTIEFNKSIESIVYEEKISEGNDIIKNIYLETVENTLKLIEGTYGIKYYGNTSKILTRVLLYCKDNPISLDNIRIQEKAKNIKGIIKSELIKAVIIAEKITSNLENNLDTELDIRIKLIILIYVFTMMSNEASRINALIVAHGYSTASSIASVANHLYGEFIFEAFDMPIDISPIEVKKKIKNYINTTGPDKGTIILVDMGSLIGIDSELESIMTGELGVINNITTNIALEIAGNIINGKDVKSMITNIEQSNTLMCKYIKAKNKKKAILTTCISGIGTAVKLRKLIKECIGDADIEVKEYEYSNLNIKGKEDRIFKDYDVKLIISTTKLEVEGVNTILLEDLMSGECDNLILEALRDCLNGKDIDSIRQDLIKMFSMNNLISRMTILNPNKVINEVETIIANYERILGIPFSPELKMTLYIHISVLIERIMLKQGLEFNEDEETIYKKHKYNFIKASKNIFLNISREYNLEIPIKEIYIIESIIESRVGKFNI